MNEKVCLTTFVYGENYKNFIPLFIYSALKSYPEYDVILYVHDSLNSQIKSLIRPFIDSGKCLIFENSLPHYKIKTAFEARTVRWVLPKEDLLKYDYVYIVDIDIFYIREPMDLHIQHMLHMKFLGAPISNIIRKYRFAPRSNKGVYHRFRDVGFRNFIRFIKSAEQERLQLTGLHFFEVKSYYEKIESGYNYLQDLLITKKYLNNLINNDEVYLYDLVNHKNNITKNFAMMSDSVGMLDFNNPTRHEFRPHHGFHMGIFRVSNKTNSNNPILLSKTYSYYLQEYRNLIKDKVLLDILDKTSPAVSRLFHRMHAFYGIKPD